MRILHVITSLRTGGAEKLMVDLLPRLRELGNNVELLVFDGTRTPFYEELESKGITIHHLQIGGNVYNPLNITRLFPYLNKFDIIHTHNTAPQMYVALCRICCKCKIINTEHSTSNRRRKWQWFKYIDRWMYNQYDKVICISEIAEKSVRDYIGGNPTNLCTINNGVDIEKYKNALPNTEIKKQFEGLHTAIMVAGFRWEKDHATLIKAYSHLPKDYHLLLAGTGVLEEQHKALCKNLNLSDRVHFLGMRTDIPSLLKSVEVVIMSSHFEGLSLSSVEGMASGNPFIASDVNGLREVVQGAGVLFPHEDEKTLAKEIQKLTEEHDYREKVISLCQNKAKAYDIATMANLYNSLYKTKNYV